MKTNNAATEFPAGYPGGQKNGKKADKTIDEKRQERVPTKPLFLTFDDGPNQGTDEVLEALNPASRFWADKRRHLIDVDDYVPAAFFICAVSQKMDVTTVDPSKWPALDPIRMKQLNQMKERNYVFGNHTYCHYPFKGQDYLKEYGKWGEAEQKKFRLNLTLNLDYFQAKLNSQPAWKDRNETFEFRYSRLPGGGFLPKNISSRAPTKVTRTEMLRLTNAIAKHVGWDFEYARNNLGPQLAWTNIPDHQNWMGIEGVACSQGNRAMPAAREVVLFHDSHWHVESKRTGKSQLGIPALVAILAKLSELGFKFDRL